MSKRTTQSNTSKAKTRLNAVRKASKATKAQRVELLRGAGIVDSKGRLTKRFSGK